MDSMQYKIAGRRKELNLTQNELAEKIGVSAKVISKWETGRSIPDTIFLVPLCDALQMRLEFLLGGEGTCASQRTDRGGEAQSGQSFTCIEETAALKLRQEANGIERGEGAALLGKEESAAKRNEKENAQKNKNRSASKKKPFNVFGLVGMCVGIAAYGICLLVPLVQNRFLALFLAAAAIVPSAVGISRQYVRRKSGFAVAGLTLGVCIAVHSLWGLISLFFYMIIFT